jgi:hypothetical protein
LADRHTDASIARDDTCYATIVFIYDLCGSKSGIDFYAKFFFGLLSQPAAKISFTDDVIAMVVHLWRSG